MSEPKEEKLNDLICCNNPVSIMRNADFDGKTGIGIWCVVCETRAFHEDEKTAIEMMKGEIKKKQEKNDGQRELDVSPPEKKIRNKQQPTKSTALIIKPKNAGELESYFHKNQQHLIEITSPVIGDMKAMERLISNNMRYVQNLKGDVWTKIWNSPEGQESIIHETEEALMMGAEMGKMGDLVPYPPICKFIESVEALEFALTNGRNAPFEWIKIENKFYGDQVSEGRKDGDFFLDFNSFGDRMKVEKVYVYGLNKKSKHIEGDVYSAERLLEKAAVHSTPYINYLKIMNAFEYAKSEGKSKIDNNGREFFIYYTIKDSSTDRYFQKSVDNFRNQEAAGTLKKDNKGEYAVEVIPKKSGGTFEKKLYRSELEGSKQADTIFIDELTNPYAGPDQPEMLRKSAGKSFLRKYGKVRNSEAAMDEVRSHKKTVDRAFDLAAEYMD